MSLSNFLAQAGLSVCIISLAAACSLTRRSPLPPVPARLVGATISKGDVAADIDMLFETIERIRPDLYSLRKREDLMAARKRLVAGLTERVGRADMWMRLAPLVASLGYANIAIHEPAEEVVRRVNAGELVFPYTVTVAQAGGAPIVTPGLMLSDVNSRNGKLKTGDRILEINGQDVADLIFRFTMLYSGPTPEARANQAATAFGDLLMLHGIPAPFEVHVARADGRDLVAKVDGAKCQAAFGAAGKRARAKVYEFRLPHSALAATVSARSGVVDAAIMATRGCRPLKR